MRGITGAQVAIALFALGFTFMLAGVALTALRDDDTAPLAPSTTVVVAESPAAGPEVDEVDSDEGSRSSVVAIVAGFGLLGLWVVGGGVALARAHRRRSGEPEQDAT